MNMFCFFIKLIRKLFINSNDLKFQRVIEKNTFYFYNQKFEEKYEGYLNSIKQILLLLKMILKIMV